MAEHGYGDETDCTCGRNFRTVRGLREHLTKSRKCVECGIGNAPVNMPRWDQDPVVIRSGWVEGRCGNCGTLTRPTTEGSD